MFNKSDICILGIIYDLGGTIPLKGVSVNNLTTRTKLSHTKVRTSLKMFIEKEMIQEGLMQKNAKTFFVNNKGIDLLKEMRGDN